MPDPLDTLRSDRNPTYRSYKAMRRRCNNPDNEDYGGRSITYDDAWEDFEVFLNDMGPRPFGHTLDRINESGHYTKANCRWATHETQANNRRSFRLIEFRGETLSVTQWARRFGISDQTVFHRLRAGWEVERALTTPPTLKFRGNQWTP